MSVERKTPARTVPGLRHDVLGMVGKITYAGTRNFVALLHHILFQKSMDTNFPGYRSVEEGSVQETSLAPNCHPLPRLQLPCMGRKPSLGSDGLPKSSNFRDVTMRVCLDTYFSVSSSLGTTVAAATAGV